MKILFFIESLRSGGKERLIIELLKGLMNNNIETQLVITKKNISYKEVEKLGIKIHCIERKRLKKDPTLFFKFYKICKSYKPDIIHVWGDMVAIYAIPAKIILKIPLINNRIVNAPQKIKGGLLSHKSTFPFSNVIVANSNAGLLAYNAPKHKSCIIYNGLDMTRIRNVENPYHVKNKLGITTNHIVGMLATFSKTKDYKTYIQAANLVLKRFNDVTFLCIGSGDYNQFKQLVEPQFEEKIKFLGYQEDIESILNICNIGVLATYTEGISMALMEFMAYGKPVIATDGGGTKELIIDGETGFLIRPKSIEELSLKIEFLIKNEDTALKMGLEGKKRIKQEFGLDKMTNLYINLYSNIAGYRL